MKMNIRAKVLALSAAIIAAGAIGIGVSSSNAAENSTSKTNTQKIGIERANQIALEAVPGKIKSVELEKENGKTYYDYEIIKDNKEYDVHIDAYSGQTLKVKIDDDAMEQKQQGTVANGNKPVTSPSSKPSSTPAATPAPTSKPSSTPAATTAPTSQPAQKQMITVEKAAELAAKHVEGTVKKIKLEKEDGKRIYEVKLKSSHGKVEVEIDAYTGEILEVDYDNYKEYYKEQNKYKNKNPKRDFNNKKDKDEDDDDDDDDDRD
ncbi:PepSY domain-containing protein [Paenibacillus sp. IITD108]|uniref:PepSY domain-containing protein n=1 Tax=Paenibacillus sp. IITD108 TaxID=3116649 RepID=UPI002F3FAA2E